MFSSELFRKNNVLVWSQWSSPEKETFLFHQGSALPAEQLEHSVLAITPSFVLLLLLLNTFLVLEKSLFVKWDPITGDIVWRSDRITAVPDGGKQGIRESLGAWEPDCVEAFPVKPAAAHCFSEYPLFISLYIEIVILVFSKNSELFQEKNPCAR